MRHITEYFYFEASMSSYISEHGIKRHNITYMGSIAGGRFQLSYWAG